MHLFEHFPLVLVTRVGRFDREGIALNLEEQIDDFFERHVPVVWAWIVAPTHVDAYLLGRNAGEGVVEHLDVLLHLPTKLVDAGTGKTRVSLHGQVWTIQL